MRRKVFSKILFLGPCKLPAVFTPQLRGPKHSVVDEILRWTAAGTTIRSDLDRMGTETQYS